MALYGLQSGTLLPNSSEIVLLVVASLEVRLSNRSLPAHLEIGRQIVQSLNLERASAHPNNLIPAAFFTGFFSICAPVDARSGSSCF